ncbi:MAG TPA: protein kinase [Polyangium sp.]|nr:protein kinase [Polyangium sp.]
MHLEAGRVLSDRYRLVRPLGQGSQGAVWIADHLALNTHVAVKLIDPELAKREDARERFKREATAAAQLRSAHVVQILDHGIDEGQPFIVMELLEGEDLFERLDKRGRLSLRETSKIITQVCRALARAHAAGIVHRDLKPENVFLCNNEDEEIVKVLDFGVAKVTDPAKATMQKTGIGTLIGTPHYMSPEQVKGTTEVDFRTDLWAIGVIAYQCVVGDLPFDSEGVGDLLIKISIAEPPVPSKVFPGASPVFDAWFAKACERDRNKRFQSARELAEALARVVASVPEAMRGAPPPRPLSVRPPPIAASPSSVRGTKPGLNPSPQAPASVRRPPALPTPQAPAPKIIEPAPQQLAEQEIDDFDFDFDEEPPVGETNASAPAPAAPAAAPPPAKVSSAGSAPAATPIPPPRASAPGTPLPAARPVVEAAPPTATPMASAPVVAAPQPPPATTNLGAPVFDPGMLAPAPRATPAPAAPAPAPKQVVAEPISSSGDRVSPPPELDGSRKSKTLWMLLVVFVLVAGGVAYAVYQSNMLPPDTPVLPSASAVAMPEPPPVVVVPSPSVGFAEPVTSKAPTPKYTGKPLGPNKAKTKPGASTEAPGPKPADTGKSSGEVIIETPLPPPDEESVPPAP